MKKTLLFSGAAAVTLFAAGCRPELAQGVYGAEEQQWYEMISSSYSSYRPPRIASPATADKAAPEALAKQRALENQGSSSSIVEVPPPAAADDNAAPAVVERPADDAAQKPAAAPKAEEKAVTPKTGEKKVETPKTGEKKVETPKTGEKKVETPKTGEKKAATPKAEEKKTGDLDYEIYKVQPGDTPGSIARKFYGKASMYEIILKANPQIKDAKLIQIGTELKVPKL